jgi:hypothetical protein
MRGSAAWRLWSLSLLVVVAGCGSGVTVTSTLTGATEPDGVLSIPGPPEGRTLAPPSVPPAGACHYVHAGARVLPDAHCTPGEADARVTPATVARTICRSGYTATVRPSLGYTDPLKRRLMVSYGLKGSASLYELDHLIPLEGGGAPAAVANLWPEPYAGPGGARSKDAVENYIHRRVCAGHASDLERLQRDVAVDWTQIKSTGGG